MNHPRPDPAGAAKSRRRLEACLWLLGLGVAIGLLLCCGGYALGMWAASTGGPA